MFAKSFASLAVAVDTNTSPAFGTPLRPKISTGVEVTPDLKFCKVYISVLGDEEAKADTMAGLKSAAGFIRRELARTVNLRNTPELKFVMDQSIEYGMKMSKLIDEVNGNNKEESEDNE